MPLIHEGCGSLLDRVTGGPAVNLGNGIIQQTPGRVSGNRLRQLSRSRTPEAAADRARGYGQHRLDCSENEQLVTPGSDGSGMQASQRVADLRPESPPPQHGVTPAGELWDRTQRNTVLGIGRKTQTRGGTGVVTG